MDRRRKFLGISDKSELKKQNFNLQQKDEFSLSVDYDKEIIIIKDGLLADTDISFQKECIWLTLKTPLLRGTTRARLIDSDFLKCVDLVIDDLKKAQNFAIMNALIDFKIIKNFFIKI